VVPTARVRDNRHVGYELYVLPAPAGEDLEDAAEALLALLRAGHLREPHGAGAADRPGRVADALLLSGHVERVPPDARAPHWIRLEAPSGLIVTVAPAFVRVQAPFDWTGEDASAHFETLFEVLARVVEETGWQVYDPQDATPVAVNDRGRQATLEIYLSVMDQLRPGRTPA
jgi:hypothetical protein